jgi:hypothetical protein
MAADDSADALAFDRALEDTPLGWLHVAVFGVCGCAWMVDGMAILLLALIAPAVRCEWGVSALDAAFMTTVVRLNTPMSAAEAAGRRDIPHPSPDGSPKHVWELETGGAHQRLLRNSPGNPGPHPKPASFVATLSRADTHISQPALWTH